MVCQQSYSYMVEVGLYDSSQECSSYSQNHEVVFNIKVI